MYKKIKKELAILIHERFKTCNTEKEKNRIVNECRQEMNVKYGYDWRNWEYL